MYMYICTLWFVLWFQKWLRLNGWNELEGGKWFDFYISTQKIQMFNKMEILNVSKIGIYSPVNFFLQYPIRLQNGSYTFQSNIYFKCIFNMHTHHTHRRYNARCDRFYLLVAWLHHLGRKKRRQSICVLFFFKFCGVFCHWLCIFVPLEWVYNGCFGINEDMANV